MWVADYHKIKFFTCPHAKIQARREGTGKSCQSLSSAVVKACSDVHPLTKALGTRVNEVLWVLMQVFESFDLAILIVHRHLR